jgi:transcriptional regulator with XRE-family HTH domain
MYTWTGREVKLLREARRLSVREFAAHLGVSDRMVSKWEAGGANIRPRPVNQAALDTSLRRADSGAQELFYAALAYASTPTTSLKITANPYGGKNTFWVVHVPVWADSREEVVALAERISTALGRLPGVEIERLEIRRESKHTTRER